MLSRIMRLFLFGLIATLIALFSITLYISIKSYDGLYLIIPKDVTVQGADIKEIEKINDNEMMLTYVKKQQKVVAVGHVKHDVALISTNYSFPFVCKYQMINGGFFTKDNQDQKTKNAILNQPAAFQMFGSMDIIGSKFTIDGEEYNVRGIINDNSENKNIFIAMILSDENPNSFMIDIDGNKGVSIEYVRNVLKTTGITEENYSFINMGLANERIAGKAGIAFMIFLSCILVLLLLLCVKFLNKKFKLFTLVNKELYFKDLLRSYPKEVADSIGILTTIILLFTMLVSILLWFVEIYLHSSSAANLPIVSEAYFSDKFVFLQKLNGYSNSVFVAFAFFLISFFLCYYLWSKSESTK